MAPENLRVRVLRAEREIVEANVFSHSPEEALLLPEMGRVGSSLSLFVGLRLKPKLEDFQLCSVL